MTYDFKPNKYNNGETPVVINLTRKQVLQMSEMVEKFKDVENFELHVDKSSGTGTTINFKFTLALGESAEK
jgi:hypothetical protein